MDPDILAEFFAEGNEHLDALEVCLLRLESEPTHKDSIDRSFRAVHSIKGAAGFLDLPAVEKLTHAAEDLLELLRQGKVIINAVITGVLLRAGDRCRLLLQDAHNGVTVPVVEVEPMVASIRETIQQATSPVVPVVTKVVAPPVAPPVASPVAPPVAPPVASSTGPVLIARAPRVPRPVVGAQAAPSSSPVASSPVPTPTSSPVPTSTSSLSPSPSPVVPSSPPSSPSSPSPSPAAPPAPFQLAPPVAGAPLAMPTIPGAPPLIGRAPRVPRPVAETSATVPVMTARPTAPVVAAPVVAAPVAAALVVAAPVVPAPVIAAPVVAAPAANPPEFPRRRSTDFEDKDAGTIRVDITLLDDIMNLVGELVVARNRLIQIVGDREDRVLSQASRRVDHLTSDLQGRVMKTRMRPVAMAWGAIPRLVRDVANATGKMVTVEMQGQDTELDRSLLEVLKDPLSHIIRNSVDHGIETPEKRIAAGKLPMGTITLKSHHSGGQVHIEVSDDGGGIQVEKVHARAVANGLVTREEADSMSDEALMALIFRPGFSTAEAVTNLSGRGVGMDVVKSSVEKVGGSADIRSVLGKGTTIRMRLPLTLAIVPALITLVSGRRFCIPQANLIEIVDLMTPASQRQVEWLAGSALLRLRGQLLPLVHLCTILGMTKFTRDIKGYVVVVEADDLRYGIVVDDIQHTEEIVIKPIGVEIKQALIYSGATVLGDGSVALIFDVAGLGRKGRVAVRQAEREAIGSRQNNQGELMTLLRLEVEGIGLVAVDVRHVVRVDEARSVEVFRHGSESLFRFQDKVVPLQLLNEGAWSQIVVCERDSVLIGLAVQAVMDVVTQPVQLNPNLGGAWAAGVAFILGQPTTIIDVKRLNFGRSHETH